MLSSYILRLHLAGDLRQVPGLGSLAVELHLPMPTHSLKEESGSPCPTLSFPEGSQPGSNEAAGLPATIRCPTSVRDHVTLHP